MGNLLLNRIVRIPQDAEGGSRVPSQAGPNRRLGFRIAKVQVVK
jgi:hypothetical protein